MQTNNQDLQKQGIDIFAHLLMIFTIMYGIISVGICKICMILYSNLFEGRISMFYTIIGISLLIFGFWALLDTYKNRYKINMAEIIFKKERDRYEVDNEKKFLRVKNIKSLFIAVSLIIIGVLGLLWSTKVYYVGGMILGASNYIFSVLVIKYLKPKAKVYL